MSQDFKTIWRELCLKTSKPFGGNYVSRLQNHLMGTMSQDFKAIWRELCPKNEHAQFEKYRFNIN